MGWMPPKCHHCRKHMQLVLRDGRTSKKKNGRYWYCEECVGSPEPKTAVGCPWCSRKMNFYNAGKGQWKGVPIWWCLRCRYEGVNATQKASYRRYRRRSSGTSTTTNRKGKVVRRKVIPYTGRPLGDRSVPPGSMFDVKKDSSN
jgi:hypothetical protein